MLACMGSISSMVHIGFICVSGELTNAYAKPISVINFAGVKPHHIYHVIHYHYKKVMDVHYAMLKYNIVVNL